MSWNVEQLSLSVGARSLIENLNLHVQPGERWVILGVNGCGKSTLLRALGGLPLDDAVRLHTQSRRLLDVSLSAASLPTLARLRALLPQHADIAPHTPAGNVLQLAARGHLHMMQAVAGAWNVQGLLAQPWSSLSGGERARLLLAACAAQDTPCVLLDEPFAAMDWGEGLAATDRVRGWGKTVVAVMHDVNLAQRLATHALLFLPHGHWAAGPAGEVFTAPLLSNCLAAPIRQAEPGGQRIWYAM
jgi:iron complex transport system ATP-binding protein